MAVMKTVPCIRQALPQDGESVIGTLQEAAHWLQQNGMGMWRDDELLASRLTADVEAGLFFIAECGGEGGGSREVSA